MTFAKYPDYKNSGVEWLGEVPSDWDVTPFKWHIERNDGGVWGDDPDGENDTIVLRSTEQTVDGRWILESPASRKLSPVDKQAAQLSEGDLLVTKSSGSSLHIGKTTLVTPEVAELDCCYSNFMQRIRVRQSFVPKFAWYVMNNDLARLQFDYLSNSTTGLANLNGTMIGAVLLAIPSSAEQKAITAFLDQQTAKIDALMAEQQKLIALLKEKRQAVISHTVTKGLDATVPMKDSGVEWLGEVPAHWALHPLKYLVRFQSGGTPSKGNPDFWDGDIPWASAKDMKVDVLVDTEDHITATAVASGAASLVAESALIVVVRGMILAHTFPVAQLARSLSINQDLKALLPSGAITSGFLAWTLRGLSRETLDRVSEAGHGTCALRMEDWVSMTLPVPPIEEQAEIERRIVSNVHQLDALIREARTATVLLQERRTALISAAVTGKIDVRAAIAQPEEVA